VSSAVIGSATCAEKPGLVLAMSFVASSCETACLVRFLAEVRRLLENPVSLLVAPTLQVERGGQSAIDRREVFGVDAP
jgi:hypothetical protein